MGPAESVPEDDRHEQAEPPSHDRRLGQAHPFDQPEADMLEQELPVEDSDEEPTGLDAERLATPDDDRDEFAPRTA